MLMSGNMGHLLKKCDLAITTTNCLAAELKKYVPKVIINRNVASEMMLDLSRQANSTARHEVYPAKITNRLF